MAGDAGSEGFGSDGGDEWHVNNLFAKVMEGNRLGELIF